MPPAISPPSPTPQSIYQLECLMAERRRTSAERQRASAHLVAMSESLAEAKTDAERDLCQVVYDAAWKLYQEAKAAEDAALGAAPPETTPPPSMVAESNQAGSGCSQCGWSGKCPYCTNKHHDEHGRCDVCHGSEQCPWCLRSRQNCPSPATPPPSVVWADLYEQRGWIRLFRVFPGTTKPDEEILSRDTVLSKRSPLLMMNPQEGMSWAAVKDLLHALGVKIHELT